LVGVADVRNLRQFPPPRKKKIIFPKKVFFPYGGKGFTA
jgi:hypothetical protein